MLPSFSSALPSAQLQTLGLGLHCDLPGVQVLASYFLLPQEQPLILRGGRNQDLASACLCPPVRPCTRRSDQSRVKCKWYPEAS